VVISRGCVAIPRAFALIYIPSWYSAKSSVIYQAAVVSRAAPAASIDVVMVLVIAAIMIRMLEEVWPGHNPRF
jgi:hypothetical protein